MINCAGFSLSNKSGNVSEILYCGAWSGIKGPLRCWFCRRTNPFVSSRPGYRKTALGAFRLFIEFRKFLSVYAVVNLSIRYKNARFRRNNVSRTSLKWDALRLRLVKWLLARVALQCFIKLLYYSIQIR